MRTEECLWKYFSPSNNSQVLVLFNSHFLRPRAINGSSLCRFKPRFCTGWIGTDGLGTFKYSFILCLDPAHWGPYMDLRKLVPHFFYRDPLLGWVWFPNVLPSVLSFNQPGGDGCHFLLLFPFKALPLMIASHSSQARRDAYKFLYFQPLLKSHHPVLSITFLNTISFSSFFIFLFKFLFSKTTWEIAQEFSMLEARATQYHADAMLASVHHYLL